MSTGQNWWPQYKDSITTVHVKWGLYLLGPKTMNVVSLSQSVIAILASLERGTTSNHGVSCETPCTLIF